MRSFPDSYFVRLEFQMEVNKGQLHELQSLVRLERFKIYAYLVLMLVMIGFAAVVGYRLLRGGIDDRFEHYDALVNIGLVFILFGLFEVLPFLTDSLNLSARLRRLVVRQLQALNDAANELAQHHGD